MASAFFPWIIVRIDRRARDVLSGNKNIQKSTILLLF